MTTKIITRKFKTFIFSAILLLIIVSTSLFLINRNTNEKLKISQASNRLPDVITTVTTPIPLNQTTPITIYFSYGDPSSDTNIVNPISTLTLDNSSLQFATAGFKDLYFGDPNRADSVNPPQVPTCNSSYAGPSYDISSSLANPFSLTYGLQSARNLTSPSGSNTVNFLREKSTGCIQTSLILSNVAVPGSTVQVIFDEDSQNSPSYALNQRPARQIVVFTIAALSSSSSSSVNTSSSSLTTSSSSLSNSSSVVSSSVSSSLISSIPSSSSLSPVVSSSSVSSISSTLSSSVTISSASLSSVVSSSTSSASLSSNLSSSSNSVSSSFASLSSSSLSSSSLNLSSSSSSSTTLGTPNGGGLTGTNGGQAGGSIPLTNNAYSGPATYTNGSNCTILGNISSSVFRPNLGEVVDPGCPTGSSTTGQITVGNTTQPNALSNFTPLASSSSSSSINLANIITALPRTGGPGIIVILASLTALILGYISFKVYKKRVNKVDLTNDKKS